MTYHSEEWHAHRRKMQHERYIRKREEILAYQKQYRETHREEINERHRRWRMEKTVAKLREIYKINK
jgi:hypothetical protein